MEVIRRDNGGWDVFLESITLMTGLDYKKILTEAKPSQEVTICTYNLFSNISFYKNCLGHLHNCNIYVNSINEKKKEEFEASLPNVNLTVRENTHAKILLIAPDIVYLTSQNFGEEPDWFQQAVYIHDTTAYQIYYNEQVLKYLAKGKTNNIPQSWQNKEKSKINRSLINAGSYTPDYSGSPIKDVRAKLADATNWNQKFNNVNNRNIVICTYTLPDVPYVTRMIKKLLDKGNSVQFVANSRSLQILKDLQQLFPDLKYQVFDNLHAKMVLYTAEKNGGVDTVWLSSQNFGNSSWFENSILLKDSRAYRYYMNQLEMFSESKI